MWFYTSPLSSKDIFLEVKELFEWTQGYIRSKAPPKSFYTSPVSAKKILFEIKESSD